MKAGVSIGFFAALKWVNLNTNWLWVNEPIEITLVDLGAADYCDSYRYPKSLCCSNTAGVSDLYLPTALSIIMISWWGASHHSCHVHHAVLSTSLWGIEDFHLYPVYAIPETLFTFMSWFYLPNFQRVILDSGCAKSLFFHCLQCLFHCSRNYISWDFADLFGEHPAHDFGLHSFATVWANLLPALIGSPSFILWDTLPSKANLF